MNARSLSLRPVKNRLNQCLVVRRGQRLERSLSRVLSMHARSGGKDLCAVGECVGVGLGTRTATRVGASISVAGSPGSRQASESSRRR